MWWNRKKREQAERAEDLRTERGKLAVAVQTLGHKRLHIEALMARMLEERARHE